MEKVDYSVFRTYLIHVDGNKIAEVPQGDLELFVSCVLQCHDSCTVTLSTNTPRL